MWVKKREGNEAACAFSEEVGCDDFANASL